MKWIFLAIPRILLLDAGFETRIKFAKFTKDPMDFRAARREAKRATGKYGEPGCFTRYMQIFEITNDPADIQVAREVAVNSYDLVKLAELTKDPADIQAAREVAVRFNDLVKLAELTKDPADIQAAREKAVNHEDYLRIAKFTNDPADIDEAITKFEQHGASSRLWFAIAELTKDPKHIKRAERIKQQEEKKREEEYEILRILGPP
jgi:hypothetical protein